MSKRDSNSGSSDHEASVVTTAPPAWTHTDLLKRLYIFQNIHKNNHFSKLLKTQNVLEKTNADLSEHCVEYLRILSTFLKKDFSLNFHKNINFGFTELKI